MIRPKTIVSFALSFIAAAMLATSVAQAEVPAMMSYQGRLQDSQGAPLDGTFDMIFAIYDVATEGTALWTETQSVAVNEGHFIVLLGSVESLPVDLFSAQVRYLGVTIGADPEMSPRRQIVTAAYAHHALTADVALDVPDGVITDADVSSTANISPTKIAGTALTLDGDNSFSGTTTYLDSAMVVSGNKVVIGRNTPPVGDDVLALKRSLATAASANGVKIDLMNSGTGQIHGLNSTAIGSGTLAIGVAGTASAATSNVGVYGTVVGEIGTKVGVHGEVSTGFSIIGVKGSVSGGGGTPYGIFGEASNCSDGYGVKGLAEGNITSGRAIDGLAYQNSGSGFGIVGRALENGGTGYGVYGSAGDNSISNWAGYFSGDVNVTGTVFSPVKISRIDHPLDPENKYLQQSDVQSPEMINVYTGNATTDQNGDAVVSMPEYFMAVNSDFRYQLTVVGQFAQAIVSSEIENNSFTIKTDKPNVKVSWQVTGIRQDRYSQAHRVVVQEAKATHEVGKYLHPELYGFGAERGLMGSFDDIVVKSQPVDRKQ